MLLKLDLATVGWQILNFAVLAVALYYLLFRPVLARMRSREAAELASQQQLKEDRAAAEVLRREIERKLVRLDEEADLVLSEARVRADVERDAILQETRAEVEQILAEAQIDAYRLRRQSYEDFHDQLLAALLDVSGLVIGRVAPEEVHRSLVQHLSDSLWELGRSDMRRVETIRRTLTSRTPTAIVRTAKPLSQEQQGQLVRTLSALADRNVNLDLHVDSALGLGLSVRLGDLVMDNTVAGKLGQMRESVAVALRERMTDDAVASS